MVNKESASKDAIDKPTSCSQVISANQKEFFKVNSLEIRWCNDILVLFKRPEYADYMGSKHKNINFSFETEKDEQMPFFDVNMFCENGKFVTNVYRKETFTEAYTNVSSSIPLDTYLDEFIRYYTFVFV